MTTFGMRSVAVFAGGVLGAVAVTKWIVPRTAQFLGARRGEKALDLLVAEHTVLLANLDAMLATQNGDISRRRQLYRTAKAGLTAHALAEEDVVYPLVVDLGHEAAKVLELVGEHAEMKRLLAEVERFPHDDLRWRGAVTKLRAEVASHAHDEEVHVFPLLREVLSRDDAAWLGGGIAREQALLL